MTDKTIPTSGWEAVRQEFTEEQVTIGAHWTFNILNDPKRLSFVLSRYKFAAKMASQRGAVLELGCSEGIGVPILAEFASTYTGVDLDQGAIRDAQRTWTDSKHTFICADFLEKTYGSFQSVVSMDVVEHIDRDQEHRFFQTVFANMADDGVAIIGTPNITSEQYASEASRMGHVNLFDGPRLLAWMDRICHNAFLFSMNDEVVHTGFTPMAHFLIAVGCNKLERIDG